MNVGTGLDLSKILGLQTRILREKKVIKSDKCMGVCQLLRGRAVIFVKEGKP